MGVLKVNISIISTCWTGKNRFHWNCARLEYCWITCYGEEKILFFFIYFLSFWIVFFFSFHTRASYFFPLQQQTSTIIFMMRSRGERKQTNNDKAFEMFKRLNKRKREIEKGREAKGKRNRRERNSIALE